MSLLFPYTTLRCWWKGHHVVRHNGEWSLCDRCNHWLGPVGTRPRKARD